MAAYNRTIFCDVVLFYAHVIATVTSAVAAAVRHSYSALFARDAREIREKLRPVNCFSTDHEPRWVQGREGGNEQRHLGRHVDLLGLFLQQFLAFMIEMVALWHREVAWS